MVPATLVVGMDSREEITAARKATAGPDLAAVERLYELLDRDGVIAGIEYLLTFCHEDLEMRTYAARATDSADEIRHDLLRGRDEVIGFFRSRIEGGFQFKLRGRAFDVDGDTVLVRGSMRVGRPDSSFAETSLRWRFHFRDGLVDEISWEPSAGG